MIAARNERVYLVLDPDEAEGLEHVLSKLSHGPKMKTILDRLKAAIARAREKGARFTGQTTER